MYENLKQYIEGLDVSHISSERKGVLDDVVEYLSDHSNASLNFICTHNSRRSQLSQVWAWAVANYYNISINSYSGGTEVTAFHPNAVHALATAGFHIHKEGEQNPMYEVKLADDTSIHCFSKVFDDITNPSTDFAALMTCSNADEGCPFISGADLRIRLLYEDPKVSDGTGRESEVYGERSRQIATEMKYIFSQIK